MSPPYKECPFCDRVFEIGTAEDGPMKRHIRTAHTNEDEERISSGYATAEREVGTRPGESQKRA